MQRLERLLTEEQELDLEIQRLEQQVLEAKRNRRRELRDALAKIARAAAVTAAISLAVSALKKGM